MINKPTYKKTLICNDFHIPYHDEKAVKCMMSFSKYYKPDDIIIAGDLMDCYGISKYSKNPQNKKTLKYEIGETKKFLSELRKQHKKASIVYLEGNHEKRLEAYKTNVARELFDLDQLNIKELLDLKSLNIEYEKKGYIIKYGILIKHGQKISQYSSYTAKREFDSEGMSGISGHSHRLGVYFRTQRGGEYVWHENGCLCSMDQEYMGDTVPNWQLGFSIGRYNETTKLFNINQIPIIEGRAMYGGMEFS